MQRRLRAAVAGSHQTEVPELTEATGAGRRSSELAELGANERGQQDQIEPGEVVDHVEAVPSPTSPALERAGSGRGRAAARRRHGGSGAPVVRTRERKMRREEVSVQAGWA
jgi:hypothetical protein